MLTKTELLTILALTADADLSAVREKVRGMHDWQINELAAEIVMGWEKGAGIGWYLGEKAAIFCRNDIRWKDYWWHPTDSLDAAAALMPKIEEMGLWSPFTAELSKCVGATWCVVYNEPHTSASDAFNLIKSSARQRTEAAVLAVVGRCFQ